MLPQQRRRPARPAGALWKPNRGAQGPDGPERRVLELHEELPLGQVRVLSHLGDGKQSRRRAPVGLAEVHDLLLAVLHRPLLDQRVDDVRVLGPREHVLEELRPRPLRIPHRSAETIPLARLQGHHPDITIPAREDRGGRPQRHPHAGAPLEYTVLGHPADVLGTDEESRDGLGAGDVDLLPGTDTLAARHGGNAPDAGDIAAKEVGGKGAVLQRWLAWPAAVTASGAGEMKGIQVPALPVRIGAGLTKGCDGDHHQVGIARGKRAVVETPGTHLLRRVVLDEDVAPRQQVQQPLTFLGRARVEDDAALVRVEEEEEAALLLGGDVLGKGTPSTGDVSTGGLDLDDVRPVIGEELGAEGRRDLAPQLHHTNSGQHVVGHGDPSSRE